MLTSKSFNKLTRRGKLLKVLREHYLRDDIPCGAFNCAVCAGSDTAAASVVTAAGGGDSAALSRVWLSPEPTDGVVVIPDTNIILHQMDVLELGGAAITDVVVLQTVLGETRHRHGGKYAQLLALMRDGSRRFVPFANEHHAETHADRRQGESSNDYSDRLVRKAAAWLAAHYQPLGLKVLLLTDDAESGRIAREEDGLQTATMRQYVQQLAQRQQQQQQASSGGSDSSSSSSQADSGFNIAAGSANILSKLADLVASHDEDDVNSSSSSNSSKAEGGGSKGTSSSSSSSVATKSSAPKPSQRNKARRGLLSSSNNSSNTLYREHWPPSRISAALASRSAFQGTLRVNRECWWEARVAVHGVLAGKSRSEGERMALGGGEDVISVLILGRDAINRAMEGDTVVIQLLPRDQWKHPSSKLAVPDANAAVSDAVAEEAEGEAAASASAEPTTSDATGEAAVASSRILPPSASDDTAAAAATETAVAEVDGEADDVEEVDASLLAAAPRDAGHDSALEELRRAAAQAAAASSSSSSGGKGAGSGLPGGVVPTGRVVGIVKRAWRHYCGSLEPEEAAVASAGDSVVGSGQVDGGALTSSALFVPVDPKVPRIRIDTRQKGSLGDKRLVVAVDGWGPNDRYPRGHYVRTIGPIGDRQAETEVILLEHDIPFRPFSQDVLACLPPADWSITPDNSRGRVDLRGIPVCSVDPPGCKDIDDALHARWTVDPASGRPAVEVGVHIADVSYFVRPGTAIDLEAAMRANTTYLVERRLDMLPGLLTETLCSLKGGVDRFAFSVTWLFQPVVKGSGQAQPAVVEGSRGGGGGGEGVLDAGLPRDASTGVLSCGWSVIPGSVRYFKSIIHSQAAMTYGQAQVLLDAPDAPTPVARGIELLASIARSLRSDRKEAGALTLASPEVRFQLDSETHDPIDVSAYELKETNSMVEEFMLLANIWTAKRTAEAFPRYAMLRRHPAPPRSQFDSLLAAAAAVGVSMEVGDSKQLADSLDAAVVTGNPYFNKLLRILATRCMMQAVYFPSGEVTPKEYAHYGLATPIYTHFTSPIRRYADVIVHRLLASALEIDPLPRDYEDLAGMRKLCDNMNKRHLMSQLAGRASGSLHTNLFFKGRIVVESGLVMRVRANGVALLVPRFGLEGVVILGRAAGEVAAGTSGLGLLKPSFGSREGAASGAGAPTRLLTYDEAGQTVADATDPCTLQLRIFDEVRVALVVEERARFRKELVLYIVDPPFKRLEDIIPRQAGVVLEDATADRPLANAATMAAMAATSEAMIADEAALQLGSSTKKRPTEGSSGSTSGSGSGSPAAKKARR